MAGLTALGIFHTAISLLFQHGGFGASLRR